MLPLSLPLSSSPFCSCLAERRSFPSSACRDGQKSWAVTHLPRTAQHHCLTLRDSCTSPLWKGNSTRVDGDSTGEESVQGHGYGGDPSACRLSQEEVTKPFSLSLRAGAMSPGFHAGISHGKRWFRGWHQVFLS